MRDRSDAPTIFDRDSYVAANSLTVTAEFSSIAGTTVFGAVTRTGDHVVVKHIDDSKSYQQEVWGVQSLVGHGGVELINRDDTANVFVMERATPGTSARYLPDDQAMTLVGNAIVAMRGIILPPPNTESLADQMHAFAKWEQRHGGSGPFDALIFDRAKRLAKELVTSTQTQVFLHGDLHLNNLLLHGDRWATIDPKGIVGDPTFEVATTLRARQKNGEVEVMGLPDPTLGWERTIQRKLDVLHDITGLDRQRMFDWSYVLSILSPIWKLNTSI